MRTCEKAVAIQTALTGQAPLGWYTGRDSPNTRRLVVDHGGFAYDSDYYGDDLPFWTNVTRTDGKTQPHLVVPYTLDSNDMRFASPQGFNTADHFFQYLRDSFDTLYAEGDDRRRCSRWGCTAASSVAPVASLPCSASSTTWRSTTACGSAAASRSPSTGGTASGGGSDPASGS